MSNWIEDALPALRDTHNATDILLRSARAIHLRQGSTRLALVTASPMHYQDTAGDWQALDTTLQLTDDGWYGAPGLPTRIHPDGRVRLTGTDYEQFTVLPGNPHGQVAGDRIVRTFPGGEQALILTPGGLREEIWLTNPNTPALNFIASQQGNLPASYAASPLFAVDAAGNEYVYNGDLPALQAWLDAATYPVLLDPDFTADGADGYVARLDTNYASARSTTPLSSYESATGILRVGQSFASATYDIWRLLLKFDTSSLGGSATVNQVNLKMTLKDTTYLSTNFTLRIAKYDWSANEPINSANNIALFDAAQNAALDADLAGTSGWSVNTQRTSANLATSWVNGASNTYYGLQSSRDRSIISPTNRNWVDLYQSEDGTAAYRPVLAIDFTPGFPQPAAIPLAAVVQPVNIGRYDTRIKLRAARRDTALTTKIRK